MPYRSLTLCLSLASAPPGPVTDAPGWTTLDEQAQRAFRAQDWLEAARAWEDAVRLTDDADRLSATQLADFAVHGALAYQRAGFPRAGLAILELAHARLNAADLDWPVGAELDGARHRVAALMEAMEREAAPPPVVAAGTEAVGLGPEPARVERHSTGVGLVYAGSVAIALGLGGSVLAGYGASLQRSNDADDHANNDRPHAHTFLGVGIASAITLVPAGIAAVVVGSGRLHDARQIAVRPMGAGFAMSGCF